MDITVEYLDQEIANIEHQREQYWILFQKADGALQALQTLRGLANGEITPSVVGQNGAVTQAELAKALGTNEATIYPLNDGEDS